MLMIITCTVWKINNFYYYYLFYFTFNSGRSRHGRHLLIGIPSSHVTPKYKNFKMHCFYKNYTDVLTLQIRLLWFSQLDGFESKKCQIILLKMFFSNPWNWKKVYTEKLFATFLLAISRIFLDSLEISHKIMSCFDTKMQIFGRKFF